MRLLSLIESYVVMVFRALVGIAFLVLIVAVLVQVTGRLSGSSPVWSEELTRFALLYLAAIGAGLVRLRRIKWPNSPRERWPEPSVSMILRTFRALFAVHLIPSSRMASASSFTSQESG